MQGISRTRGRAQSQAKPLTAEALATVKATARSRRSLGTDGRRQESAERAAWRGRVDVTLLSILRDGLLRRSEAAALTWADVELRDNGSALLQVHRSKTDPEGEGVVLYIGKEAGEACGPSGRRRSCRTRRRRSLDCHRDTSDGECKQRPRPAAWARALPDTAAAWAWPRSLAGKPLAGFRATSTRRKPVLFGIIIYVIRFTHPLLYR